MKEELEEQLGWLFAAAVERDEVAEYLLGLRPYAVDGRDIAAFFRLHEVVAWLAALPADERETRTLHLAAAVNASCRDLAALLLAGVAERDERDGWQPLSDAAYFTAALHCGSVPAYLAARGPYCVPTALSNATPRVRHERFCQLYLSTGLDHLRHGLRLALLGLLDGSAAERLTALSIAGRLAADDVLRSRVRAHLLVTIHSGELASLGRGDDELGASIIATLGQWRVAEALPFLQDMALGTERAPVAGSRTAAALTQTLAALGDLAA